MKYMLDTNICITLIRSRSTSLVQRLSTHRLTDVTLSSITVAELADGVQYSQHSQRNQAALDNFLLPLTILDFDFDAAIQFATLRAHLEAHGMVIGVYDMLIAAHALSRDLTIVTNNVREFNRVPSLVVEDWTQ